MGYKEDAEVNLDRADDVAGWGAGNLRDPADQANYFVLRGIVHALLHLADVIEAPQIKTAEQEIVDQEWRAERQAVADKVRVDRVAAAAERKALEQEADVTNETTTYDVLDEEQVTVNERPSPTMTILKDDPPLGSDDDSDLEEPVDEVTSIPVLIEGLEEMPGFVKPKTLPSIGTPKQGDIEREES